MSRRKLIYNTAILTLVNFVSRALGFVYKIAISKQIGAEGVGLFQVINPVLMIAVTFTTAGIPIAVSRLVSIQSDNDSLSRRKILRSSLFIGLILSVFLSFVIFIFSKDICYKILKNRDIYFSVLFLIPAIVLMSLNAVFRSYFYSIKKVSPSGISQIVEQVSKMGFVIYVLGKIGPVNPKIGLFVCVIGLSVGELLGFLWMLISYGIISRKAKSNKKSKLGYLEIFHSIFKISLPITLSSIISSILNMLNSIMIPRRLLLAGYTNKQALAILGRSLGMTLPIIFLPFAVTAPLVVNIIPILSKSMEQKRYDVLMENIRICIRITLIVSMPATLFFVFFGNPISMFLYNDKEVGSYLSIMGLGTISLSLQHIFSGILQGIGKETSSMINSFIGNILQLAFAFFLIPNPLIGINGFFIGFIVSSTFTAILHIVSISRSVNVKLNLFSYVLEPFIATLLALSVSVFTYRHISLVACLICGGLTYAFVLLINNKKSLRFIKI